MTRLFRIVRASRTDERGASLIFVAAAMALLLPVGLAFTVELGEDTVVNRSLQTAADAGALDGARYLDLSPDTVVAKAGLAVQRNYPGVVSSVVEGSWTSAGGFVPSLTCASSASCTAVKVTTSSTVKHLFETGSSALNKSAIATVSGLAGFSIGTYLASVSTSQLSVLNGLLSNLGASGSLTLVGYQGLAHTNITVQQLIDASGGVLTPSNVLTTSLTGTQWNSFLTTAVTSQAGLLSCGGSPTPFPCSAQTQLSSLGLHGSAGYSLCQLVSINGSTCSGGNLSESALQASLNVMQTLTTEAELANGSTGLDVKSILSLGVASAKLITTLIQVPQVAYGPIGTTATSSQINVDLQIQLLGSLNALDIPITGADGTATLAAISCSNNALTSTTINASTTALSNSITLLGLPIASIAINGAPSTPLVYTTVPPTTTSVNSGTNPQTISATPATFSIGGLSFVNNLLVGPLLNGLATSLVPVLQALGVTVAGAQVADLSTNCAASTLVG